MGVDTPGVAQVGITVFTARWCQIWDVLWGDLCALVEENGTPALLDALKIVDVDDEPDRADQERISTLPTVVVRYPDGREMRKTGAVSPADLLEFARRVQPTSAPAPSGS